MADVCTIHIDVCGEFGFGIVCACIHQCGKPYEFLLVANLVEAIAICG